MTVKQLIIIIYNVDILKAIFLDFDTDCNYMHLLHKANIKVALVLVSGIFLTRTTVLS